MYYVNYTLKAGNDYEEKTLEFKTFKKAKKHFFKNNGKNVIRKTLESENLLRAEFVDGHYYEYFNE